MVNIKRINTYEFKLPMIRSLEWGLSGKLEELKHVLIEVELDDGSIGLGEATPRPTIYGETSNSISSIISQEFSPYIIGKEINPESIREIWNNINRIKNNNTAKGSLDIALHDAYKNSLGLTTKGYFGIDNHLVPVSYILGIKDLSDSITEANDVYSKGVRVLKVKVGKDFASDYDRIRELLNNIPQDMKFYVDANECFNPDDAENKLDLLKELGCLYCEEPIDISLIKNRRSLREKGIIPLIADDSVKSMNNLDYQIKKNTFDILNIKSPKTGITESLDMILEAEKNGKQVMFGSHASSSLGAYTTILLATIAKSSIASEASFFVNLYDDIVENPIRIVDGYVRLADIEPFKIRRELLK